MAIDANIVNFGQSNPTGQAISSLGGALGGAIQANKQSGLAENRKLAAGYLAQAFDDSSDEATTRALIEKAREADPEFTLATMQQVQKNTSGGGASSAEKAFNDLIKDLSPEDQDRARRIKLGLDSRSVGSASQTIADQGTSEIVGESQAIIEGAKAKGKEAGKLEAQLIGKPEVDSAVKLALSDVDSYISDSKESKSASKALAVYDIGVKSLSDSLASTTTGPIVGWLPALSSSAQVAEGAISAMAPILKKMFRESGEGTFTDSDQLMLLNMMPTRSDRPEAVLSKLKNIDAIVRAKLSGDSTTEKQVAPNAAIEMLKNNPEMADQFKAKYGYLPEM